MGRRRNVPDPANAERDALIAEARRRGDSFRTIAAAYGVTRSRAYFIAKRLLNGPSDMLLAEQVRKEATLKMAELYRAGRSAADIAREFGVDKQIVYDRMHVRGVSQGPKPLWDRLAKRIDFRMSGCWVWTGKLTTAGYGTLDARPKGRSSMVHRLVYEELIGPIPAGKVLDHLCRAPECVNPGHLDVVSHAENCRRGVWRNAVAQSPHATKPFRAVA